LLDDKALFPGTTPAGRHLNRRVVVKVVMNGCPSRSPTS
jgi:outer membrane protein OmpA-like peptidoglycan-associated protein